MSIILTVLYIVACFVLILFVLLQPGKSDASQVFGGGANSSAFGPRGTATVLAKVTITAAIAFFLIAFLFSIPGLFEERSLGEGVPVESAPAAPSIPLTPEPATPDAGTSTPPAASTDQGASSTAPAQKGATQPAKPAQPSGAAKPNANR